MGRVFWRETGGKWRVFWREIRDKKEKSVHRVQCEGIFALSICTQWVF